MAREPLLRIRDLHVRFETDEGVVHAVNGLDLAVGEAEVVGLVGESGCGKSVTALSVLRLVPQPPGQLWGKGIVFRGKDLLREPEDRLRQIRGRQISMIFQEPMSALNPVFPVGEQIAEVYRVHLGLSRREAWERAVEMLDRVGIPSAGVRAREYPHQYSGGMKQRAMIAMALACGPSLLIADEPTTALDVTIQAQILDLLMGLRAEFGMAILLITHDLAIVAETADRVAVMYAGRVVEQAPVEELFRSPLHPYTRGLLASLPHFAEAGRKLRSIQGTVPGLGRTPHGCSFAPRCEHAWQLCRDSAPPRVMVTEGHEVECWLFREAGRA